MKTKRNESFLWSFLVCLFQLLPPILRPNWHFESIYLNKTLIFIVAKAQWKLFIPFIFYPILTNWLQSFNLRKLFLRKGYIEGVNKIKSDRNGKSVKH